jgi:hypothetical protein
MLEIAHSAARDDRNVQRVGERARELEIESQPRAIAIHAGEQDLAGAELLRLAPPLQRIDTGTRVARRV